MIIPEPDTVIPRSFGTHDGTFHADEVTACALLLVTNLIDPERVVRSRDLQKLRNCEFVCDVGGLYAPSKKRFDHHQVTYTGPLSSAGMVLEHLKNVKIFSSSEYDFLNFSLVKGVDAHDNGKDPQIPGFCSFSHVISNFSPIHYDAPKEEQDKAFFQAVFFAQNHITHSLARFKYNQLSRDEVLAAMEAGHEYLLFDRPLPWMETFFELDGKNHPASFVIMPSGDFWKLRGIPPSLDERMQVRVPLPENWAGLLDSDLEKVSGIPGAIFCHKGRFISVWQTKEAAIKALLSVLHTASQARSKDHGKR